MTTDDHPWKTPAEPCIEAAGRWLDRRRREPEVMDQAGLNPELHAQALDALERLNRLSRSADSLWTPIRRLAAESPGSRPLRVLDVASGGGGNALGLARRAARAGVSLSIDGCDISPTAVWHARKSAARQQLATVAFHQRDVLREPLPGGYDVVTCSLFLHHLAERDAERFLRSMAGAAGRLVVINDLRRTRFGYLLACLACRTLTGSPVVKTDGPLSVAAAFTDAEALELASRSGLEGARLERIWPQRFLLTWRRV